MTITIRIRAAALALAACSALMITPANATPSAAGAETVPLQEAVAALPVAVEDRTGYNRQASFGGWIDADHVICSRNLCHTASAPDALRGHVHIGESGERMWERLA